jgi:hypothetical protein
VEAGSQRPWSPAVVLHLPASDPSRGGAPVAALPGAFAEYCSRVPRFFPQFNRSRLSFSYRQYISNREYNTTIGLVLALLVLILKSR